MEGNELYNSEEEPGNWGGKCKTSELCRVCASPNTYLIPIFEGEGLENELAMKIEKHLPIQVMELDNLPKHMCYQCASTLIAWHDLAMGCVEADKKLREWQREEQLQLQDSGEDKDDKSLEFYDTPSLESEMPDIDTTKSKEPDLRTPEMQTKTLKKKIVYTKEKGRYSERSTIKMTIAKNPTAGPSGYTTTKPQVVEEVKTKEGSTQEFEATKRYQQSLHTPFKVFHEAECTRGFHKFAIPSCDIPFDNKLRENRVHDPQAVYNSMKNDGYENKGENENSDDSVSTELRDNNSIRPMFESEQCERKFATTSNLNSHLRINSDERPYTCHVCGKQFRTPKGLNRHLREVHEGIKEHNCDICGRNFASKATRNDHRRIHTGERPYVCDICGNSFKTKASLYIHKKNHLNTFPYSCLYCQKRFRRKDGLSLHITTHTGERPHLCDICGKGFRVRNELARHKGIHSGEKPFVCAECGLTFGQKRYLRNHDKTHHRRE